MADGERVVFETHFYEAGLKPVDMIHSGLLHRDDVSGTYIVVYEGVDSAWCWQLAQKTTRFFSFFFI